MGDLTAQVERFYKSFEAGDFDVTPEIFAQDVTALVPGAGLMKGIDALNAYNKVFKSAFPDARMEIAYITESGDTVIAEGFFTGTHTAPLASPKGEVPPTGKSLKVAFSDFFTFKNGKVADHRTYFDQMELLGQLGLLPQE